MKLLPILLLASASAIAEPVVNITGAYDLSKSCYGMGCLPTSVLQKELSGKTYYTPERLHAEREIKLLEESNSIARERLEVERELLLE